MEKLLKDLGNGAGVYSWGDGILHLKVPAGPELALELEERGYDWIKEG